MRDFKALFRANSLISNIPSASQKIDCSTAYTNNIFFTFWEIILTNFM